MAAGIKRSRPRLTPLVLATLVGATLFARGFFPIKPLLQGYTGAQSYQDDQADAQDLAFSRLAFVVVDALRSDFLFGSESHFTFVNSLVSSGRALPYTAMAQSPTVTLPRLKALTTGSNPTFTDAILNVAEESISSAAFENVDSWLRQLALKREDEDRTKIVFAGDDTWLRLFPGTWFAWSEGVSSFFVSDTVTVDTNVTRHLDGLLSASSASAHVSKQEASRPYTTDWDVLILHYLGLDHVGHLGGPNSPLMIPKQIEMDSVVQRVYEDLERRDKEDGGKSLLVVVGDHGMTEGGNHGGSTTAETSAALLLASPSMSDSDTKPPARVFHDNPYQHYEVVQQIDLVPTLGVLNSMGRLIPSALHALRPATLRSGIQANVRQVAAVLDAASGVKDSLLCQAAKDVGDQCQGDLADQSDAVLLQFLSLAQSYLLSTASSYQLFPLYLGLGILILSSSYTCYLLKPHWRFERLSSRIFVASALAVYLGSFFATSFIEEEHEGWYFIGATGMILLALRPSCDVLDRLLLFSAAAAVRLMRAWAHNGQKNLPNKSLSLHIASSPSISSVLLLAAYITFGLLHLYNLARIARSYRTTFSHSSPLQLLLQALLLAILATVAIAQALLGIALHLLDSSSPSGESDSVLRSALEKLDMADRTTLARAGSALGGLGWGISRLLRHRQREEPLKERFSTLLLIHLTLLLLSLSRSLNAALFLLAWVQHFALHRLAKKGLLSPLGVAAWVATCQAAGFFGLGGSNSLASIDLSNSYTGLTFYSLPLVSLLTYLSNFSLPILTSLSYTSLLSRVPTSHTLVNAYLLAFHVLALTGLAVSAVWFRGHLFALTVFAPAVLMRGTWFVWVMVGTNLGLSRILVG
ncbi:hypothetical protein JCM11641_001538 [Rhodosporidiobolus odoratus]